MPIVDSGIGTDTATINALLSLHDTGIGTDAVSTHTTIVIEDSGSGFDIITITGLISISDLGSGIDTASILSRIAITDSGIGTDTAFLVWSRYITDTATGIDTIHRRIAFKPHIIDDEDFSKPIIVKEYRTQVNVLWETIPLSALSETDDTDVSTLSSLGVYIKVSSATRIKILVETILGWGQYDEIPFTAAGEMFVNFWTLPFQRIKFQTTDPTTATIQLYLRT